VFQNRCSIISLRPDMLKTPDTARNVHLSHELHKDACTRVYPKVSGLAAWSENYKWYSSLALHGVVSLFCELV